MARLMACVLNGSAFQGQVRDEDSLVDYLRREAGLLGTREGCGLGECGACTVLLDGRAINACLMPALEVEGRAVLTIEGLRGADGGLSALQQAFVDQGAIQCGFCTPGMILAAQALLARDPDPDPTAIRQALAGNLCRCTGYAQIVEAVAHAARRMAVAREGEG